MQTLQGVWRGLRVGVRFVCMDSKYDGWYGQCAYCEGVEWAPNFALCEALSTWNVMVLWPVPYRARGGRGYSVKAVCKVILISDKYF